MSQEDIDLHERVAGLETKTEQIMTNHLPHIQAAIDKVDDRLWVVLYVIIIGFLATIAAPPIINWLSK